MIGLRKMSLYQLEIPKPVQKQIDALPGRYRQRVKRIIFDLRTMPRPETAEPLRMFADHYRIRVDEYRIVYRVEDDILIVAVIKVGRKHGSEFYEDIK
jgi:mRNA interferase RelE/StbE